MPKKQKLQRFGEKLRSLRVSRDMTLSELATKLGHKTHSYLSELEAGKKIPTVEFVLNVAHLFNVTTDELLRDDLEIDTDEER
ncbi:MAG TPA: helix-turn-helix transcriptional regulator [Pyrinomonadaceae bacterium]|jgi:transcriptional regulator with XRE-family HTH domain